MEDYIGTSELTAPYALTLMKRRTPQSDYLAWRFMTFLHNNAAFTQYRNAELEEDDQTDWKNVYHSSQVHVQSENMKEEFPVFSQDFNAIG